MDEDAGEPKTKTAWPLRSKIKINTNGTATRLTQNTHKKVCQVPKLLLSLTDFSFQSWNHRRQVVFSTSRRTSNADRIQKMAKLPHGSTYVKHTCQDFNMELWDTFLSGLG